MCCALCQLLMIVLCIFGLGRLPDRTRPPFISWQSIPDICPATPVFPVVMWISATGMSAINSALEASLASDVLHIEAVGVLTAVWSQFMFPAAKTSFHVRNIWLWNSTMCACVQQFLMTKPHLSFAPESFYHFYKLLMQFTITSFNTYLTSKERNIHTNLQYFSVVLLALNFWMQKWCWNVKMCAGKWESDLSVLL